MRRTLPTLCLLAVLTLPRLVHSQIPVTDAGNLAVNTTSAIQTIITAIENIAQTAMMVEELIPLDVIAVAGGIGEDLAALADIVNQAEGLSYDIASLRSQIDALFNLDTAPAGTGELAARLAEIRRVRHQSYTYAMRLQTLLTTANRTVEHLAGLLGSVLSVVGQKQAMQTIVQTNATISKTTTIHAAQVAAYERAGSIDKMEEMLTIESLHRINEATMADWPRRK